MHRHYQARFWISFILTLFVSSAAFSQAASDTTSGMSRFGEKAWAVQFGVSSNFTLTSLQGGLIALQRHLNASCAVRFIVTGSASKSNYDYDPTSYEPTRSSGNSSDAESGGIIAQVVNYIDPSAEVKVFWAIGPTVDYYRSYSSSHSNDTNYAQESSNYSRVWYAGVQAALGAQWFFQRSLALQAEYLIDARFRWSRNSQGSSTRTGSTYSQYEYGTSSNGWSISGNTSRLILSVYF